MSQGDIPFQDSVVTGDMTSLIRTVLSWGDIPYQESVVTGTGLGTAFFSFLNASFFCVLLKNATFFNVFFLRVFGDL